MQCSVLACPRCALRSTQDDARPGQRMTATQDADVGVTGDADAIPAFGAVSVGAVASWSARCRQRARCRGCRRRRGGGWPRAREDARGGDCQPVLVGLTSRPWVNWPISVQGGELRTNHPLQAR
jgi:hypothetical protein